MKNIPELSKRIRQLISRMSGKNRMDLTLSKILNITPSAAGMKLIGVRGFKINEVQEIAARYGISAAALLDEPSSKSPLPKIIRAEENLCAERLTNTVFPIKIIAAGDEQLRDGGHMKIPRVFVAKIDARDCEPKLAKGSFAIVSEDDKVKDGDMALVIFKGGGHAFRRIFFDGDVVQAWITSSASTPPEKFSRARVRLFRIVGCLEK